MQETTRAGSMARCELGVNNAEMFFIGVDIMENQKAWHGHPGLMQSLGVSDDALTPDREKHGDDEVLRKWDVLVYPVRHRCDRCPRLGGSVGRPREGKHPGHSTFVRICRWMAPGRPLSVTRQTTRHLHTLLDVEDASGAAP